MTDMSASVHFSIKYDGPALVTHQMDVRELAPALIGLSELLEHANKAAFPDAAPVRINVQGTFKGGSFGVDLIAVQNIGQQIMSMLSGPGATSAANLFGILSGLGLLGGGGLIGVIRWLRGRKPTAIRLEGDSAVFELQMTESVETMEVDLVAGRLYQSKVVRQALAKVVKPLERDGIDVFASGREGVAETVITKEDVPSFEQAAADAEIVSDTLSAGVLLQLESPVFKDKNKWRFNDGATSFFAELADPEFVRAVELGEERFGKGDVLVVDLRRVQSIVDAGLRLEYVVVKVHEHRAPLQQSLIP
ncbi:hypothetical protein LJR039_005444 [Pseudorhodoferax sp. LjRoot39]|uniref:hypothetical protein n=1 Tax=Pseudorhodoferax sp. LjRoot39 TaxID=3342328 RepID=UPI003ECDDE79